MRTKKRIAAVLAAGLLLAGCANDAPDSATAASGCSGSVARGIFTGLLAVSTGLSTAAQGGSQWDLQNNLANNYHQAGLDTCQ